MRRGCWHQCGDKSQRLVEEQLQQGVGVGVVISPRDIGRDNAIQWANKYRALGAEVLIDQQFYNPDYTNKHLATYEMAPFRTAVSQLRQLSDQQFVDLANALRVDHADFQADALLAPAVRYEAARPDILDINTKLFTVSKQVGDQLGIPTYASIVLGRSVTASDQTIGAVLSNATSLNADGWYFAFEFENERIPSGRESVRRCCNAGLTLACTGKPVLHAYAGPMGLLSFGFGATGAGVGHSQNLWKFSRDRWESSAGKGGNGQAPPRFFSASLWGTIIYPDETVLLPPALRSQVLMPASPFCVPVTASPQLPWQKWDANKHLVYTLASAFDQMAATTNPRTSAQMAIARLGQVVALHTEVAKILALKDSTNVYQENWRLAMSDVLNNSSGQYDYLDLLS